MKRILAFLLAIALCLTFIPMTFAVESIDNFKEAASYASGQFADVSESQWYAQSVKTAYKLGLVKGSDESHFNPTGNITIAETITLAARLHSIYKDDAAEFVQGPVWYQVYVDYAVEQGIIEEKQYSDYNAKATRAQFAEILYAALPNSEYKKINAVTVIPDVDDSKPYLNTVLNLYNAGILTGSDEYGTFNPNSNIQRCEVAAIITRIAIPSERKSVTLKVKPIEVTSVSVTPSTSTLTVGSSATLTVDYAPANATEHTAQWSTSDASVVSVNASGEITGKKAGSATVIAKIGSLSASCNVTVKERQMTSKTVYEDSKIAITFVRAEKYRYRDDRLVLYLDVTNKTSSSITVQCDAISINGYSFNSIIMSDPVAAGTIGTVSASIEHFDFDLVDPKSINTLGGMFHIICNNSSDNYYASFTNVSLYGDGSIKEYPSVSGKKLLYSDSKLSVYYDYAEEGYKSNRLDVYLTVQNKTARTWTIQNDTVVVNGRSYSNTIMSDPVLPYSTGDICVAVDDFPFTSSAAQITEIGGDFRAFDDYGESRDIFEFTLSGSASSFDDADEWGDVGSDTSGEATLDYLANYAMENGQYSSSKDLYSCNFIDNYYITYSPSKQKVSFECLQGGIYTSLTIPASMKTPYIGYFSFTYQGEIDSEGSLYVNPSSFWSGYTGTFMTYDGNRADESGFAKTFSLGISGCLYAVELNVLKATGHSIAYLGFTSLTNGVIGDPDSFR